MLTVVLAAILDRNRLIDAAEIREALRRADISIEKACLYMADPRTGKPKDRALLDRQLNGEGHLRHTDLCLLPVVFWREYLMLMLCKIGYPSRLRREMAVVLAVTSSKRMARMSAQTRRVLQQRREVTL